MSTPKALLKALDKRDGHLCAWSGIDTGQLVPQHRQGGMGGRRDKHRLSNLVWLDSLINGLIESDPLYQSVAIQRGIKVSGFADPTVTLIDHAVHGCVYLDDEGGFRALVQGR